MKEKHIKLANVSLLGDAAEKFEALSKDEQISYLADKLNPSGDIVRATQLLKGVKHGQNISNGNVEAGGEPDTTSTSGGGKKSGAAKPGADSGKS